MIHGLSGYTNHRCRCDVCRAAHLAYCRAYVAAHLAQGLCVSCTDAADPPSRWCARHRRARAKLRKPTRAAA